MSSFKVITEEVRKRWLKCSLYKPNLYHYQFQFRGRGGDACCLIREYVHTRILRGLTSACFFSYLRCDYLSQIKTFLHTFPPNNPESQKLKAKKPISRHIINIKHVSSYTIYLDYLVISLKKKNHSEMQRKMKKIISQLKWDFIHNFFSFPYILIQTLNLGVI